MRLVGTVQNSALRSIILYGEAPHQLCLQIWRCANGNNGTVFGRSAFGKRLGLADIPGKHCQANFTWSAHDPSVAVRSAAFGARNLPFIHFHPTAKSGPSVEQVIREIKRLFKIEKNPPTVTRAEGRLTRRGGFLQSTASSPTTITAQNERGSL